MVFICIAMGLLVMTIRSCEDLLYDVSGRLVITVRGLTTRAITYSNQMKKMSWWYVRGRVGAYLRGSVRGSVRVCVRGCVSGSGSACVCRDIT